MALTETQLGGGTPKTATDPNGVLHVPTRSVGAATTDFSDGNLTAGRHNYYGTLFLGGVPVGGMQAWSVRETNGTQFIPNAGNDWLEPRFGMRMWQGQGSRFMIRGRDMQELLRSYYHEAREGWPNDVDFRFMPFNWLFHFDMVTWLNKTVENLSWHVATVWITEYTWKYTSPMDLLYEDFSFIAKGMRRMDNTPGVTSATQDFGNPLELWGDTTKDYGRDLVGRGVSDTFDDVLLEGLMNSSTNPDIKFEGV